MAEKKDDKLEAVTLGIQLGNLPQATVDTMFAGLAWEAERDHGVSVRAMVAATFAAAKVEAEIMSDDSLSPKDRLLASKQFKDGFRDACRLICSEPLHKNVRHTVVSKEEDTSLPSALERMYGDQK
mgnify:CR=1 FL=1|tara:strand:- start:25 stop:402 length:378 start_codon:yes stop_codon:yes gene_type:complete